MAIITDVEAEAGFNVMIRWFAKASQRYPANENEYYFTQFDMLEPNQQFVLTDPRFNLDLVNDEDAELEYTIRDICYVQTLIPQFVGFTYIQPDYRQRATNDNIIMQGDMTFDIEYDVSGFQFAAGDVILIGQLPNDTYTIDTIVHRDGVLPPAGTGFVNQFATVTLLEPVRRIYNAETSIGQFPVVLGGAGTTAVNYPDSTPEAAVARVVDNDGNTNTDTVEVTTPIFFDTSETVRRYFYDSALEFPYNGARGPGDTVDQQLTHRGENVFGGWWALGDEDNSAAERSVLIDRNGYVLDQRERPFVFDILLSRSSTEVGACNDLNTTTYYANHSNFRGLGALGTTDFRNIDGSLPPAGFYAWTSTIPGDSGQRFVKYWNGTAFEEGRVGSGFVDNCPLALANSVVALLYSVEQDMACGDRGSQRTLYFESATNTFTAGNVTAIYTNEFGPNAASPARLASTFLTVGGNQFTWNGTDLTVNNATCVMSRYCGDPRALNTGSGDIRDDSLCVFPRTICSIDTATNYVAPGDRLSTDIIDDSTCSFMARYTATYNVDISNIVGPTYALDVTVNSDTQDDLQPWSISYSITLQDGYEWVTEPADLSESDTGTFAGSDVTIDVVIPAGGELRLIPNAPVGCNIPAAANYVAGSDGTGVCYYSAGTWLQSGSDTNVCNNFNAGTAPDTELFVTDPSGTFSDGDEIYLRATIGPLTGQIVPSGGSGFFTRDGVTFFQLFRGRVFTSNQACVIPAVARGIEFTQPSDNISLDGGQSYAFFVRFEREDPNGLVPLTVRFVANGRELALDGSTGTLINSVTAGAFLEVPDIDGQWTLTAELREFGETTVLARTSRTWNVV